MHGWLLNLKCAVAVQGRDGERSPLAYYAVAIC